jgi:hypothetical protein
VQEIGTELLPHPERAVIHTRDRFDVEVGAGEQTARSDRGINLYLRRRQWVIVRTGIIPEKPGIGCPSYGGVTPLLAPENCPAMGPGWWYSDGIAAQPLN